MLKHFILIVVTAFIFLAPNKAFSLFYLGVGGDYIIPIARLSETNKETFGLNIQLESRKYCKLWYGLRFDYFAPDYVETNFDDWYQEFVLISPKIRYNFLSNDCLDFTGKIAPYLQGMLTISSISGSDQLNLMGLGGGIGAGFAVGFQLFKTCMMLDLSGIYSAPNFLLKADGRPSLELYNLSLTWSVGL